MAKQADAKDLKSFSWQRECGFDSHPGHHYNRELQKLHCGTHSGATIGPTVSAESPSQLDRYSGERLRYWNRLAESSGRWQTSRAYYQRRLREIYSFLIPPGMRVLELGCSQGDLLAAVKPAYGVGVDFSGAMLDAARRSHPDLQFISGDAHAFHLNETFDYVICSDLVNDVWDVQQVLENAARHCHPASRLILNSYSRLWELPRRAAEIAGLAKEQLPQNWLAPNDIGNLLSLANFEIIRSSHEILWPFRTPVLDRIANSYLVKLPLIGALGLTNVFIARPAPKPIAPEPLVSVIVPARNEEGNIPEIFRRVPQLGAGTELIFVEGGSTDGTYGAIEREIEREIARNPALRIKLFQQPGTGKGDAVRTGFRHASGELLMILDADLTVCPEDLRRFYEAWQSGKAEFVNGVRLVYPMADRAMPFLNQVGNKFFSLAFTWLLSQSVKDTLCGTKALGKASYEKIARSRSYFGNDDPFGDFDLLFGAAKYNLKIVELPVRYGERSYGKTNIQRWRHGMLIFRMVVRAMSKIKFV